MPVAGAETDRYGGHTPCLDIDTGSGSYVILDAGTGIHLLQAALEEPGDDGYDFHIFFTHYHLDHIIGLPFFRPLYDERNRFTFYGFPYENRTVDEVVHQVLSPPWFPVPLAEVASSQEFVSLDGSAIEVQGVSITTARLDHPQGVAAFRIEHDGRSVVLATDYERGAEESDSALDELAKGVGTLIHDAQYTPEEYEDRYRGWGHSTWLHAVHTAEHAGVGQLVLTSHDPDRTDLAIDAIIEKAVNRFANTRAAHEGMRIEL